MRPAPCPHELILAPEPPREPEEPAHQTRVRALRLFGRSRSVLGAAIPLWLLGPVDVEEG